MDKRQEGTGQWFLKRPEFVAWVEAPSGTLLCPGIPGAGKTFMSALVVNHLRETPPRYEDTGVAVLYCSYSMREEQTKEKLLAGLLRQLINHQHAEWEKIQAFYGRCKSAGRRPSFSELSGLLQRVAGTYSRVFIVLDALDECEDTERLPLLSELRRLQPLLPSLKLMFTFRPHVDVTDTFTAAVTCEIRADFWDLEHYISEQLPRLSSHVKQTAGLRDEVIQGIIKAADGM
jgi:Cdc6-like AAA superfamily ATPase